jgi:hypothetical protein
MLDRNLQHKVTSIARCAKNRPQAVNYFRVALGLVYLDAIMTERKLDFKKIDRDYNQFIYRSLGGGHSITSILQYMSGAKVLPVLESNEFLQAFEQHCNEVPLDKVPILLSVNLGVAKDISGLGCEGPVRDWLSWRAREAVGPAAGEPAAGAPAAGDNFIESNP